MFPATIRSLLAVLLLATLALFAPSDASAEEETTAAAGYANDKSVGIDEKLGETIPTGITFNDEEGNPVELRSLITKPTVLTLVYFGCPSICSPLMHEVAHTLDEIDLVAGVDFNLVTVSFDASEGHEQARNGKKVFLGRMKKTISPESWRFLTGDAENIEKLTHAVGFNFQRDRDEKNFVHVGTVIFVTKEGKIVRYLDGQVAPDRKDGLLKGQILPFEMTMAINDAAEGTPRSLMRRIQSVCYAYDPESRQYVFQVNKIILYVSLIGLGIFLGFLLLRRRKAPASTPPVEPPGDEAPAGGRA